MEQKVAIVTGSNTGIGRETALALSRRGIKVFLACRSIEKAHKAADYIKKECPDADVQVLQLDLTILESVRSCVLQFKSRKLPLHILVNNAGVSSMKRWYTPQHVGGRAQAVFRTSKNPCPLEKLQHIRSHLCTLRMTVKQFQVNFLGPYTFTRLLEDELSAGAPSRVVNVSSIMHRQSAALIPEEFLHSFEAGSYGQTKLANVLFTYELQRQWEGKGIESCAVDPGASSSDIWRNSMFNYPVFKSVMQALYAPTWDAAIPVVHAALESFDTQGSGDKKLRYFARGAFAWPVVTGSSIGPLHLLATLCDWPIRWLSRGRFLSHTKQVPAASQAYDSRIASRLWDKAGIVAGFASL